MHEQKNIKHIKQDWKHLEKKEWKYDVLCDLYDSIIASQTIIYSNVANGETITFQYYSYADDTVYDVAETVDWISDMIVGNLINAFELNVSSAVDIAFDVASGWNWISVNVENEDMSVDNVLATIGTDLDYIKSQGGYADFYEGFGWFGTLATISVEELYKLDLANSGLLEFTGAPVDPATHPIELTSGWNWIPKKLFFLFSIIHNLELSLDAVTIKFLGNLTTWSA